MPDARTRPAYSDPVDLETAELELTSSIYDGFSTAIMVKGKPRTVALCREYGDAVQLMALIERGRASTPKPAIPASDGSQRLSDHFTLAEMTVSAAAARKGLDNTPPPQIVDQLILTADRMEKVRELLGGHPIRITSGYRSPAVNKAVGGSATSAHRTGHAVDFTCPGFGTPAQVAAHLAKHLIGYDQLIEEFGEWVHVGFGPGQRMQKLTARKVAGKTKYTQGIKA
ncbi:D-Ala-D-Ala carboxypeptidase family metallohydrolase [Brevundimonas staleyi]|uniref:D-Ala-D-Ala carboxypeptidase family metallohydrolase n=1 Tax=Brevundimonas staleyi TaxID=74326 RepID=A0ABW0FYL6_9CAUL